MARVTGFDHPCTRQSDSRRVCRWRENGTGFHPFYATKIDILDVKGILVCGSMMLDSRSQLYVFDAGTVNSQHYKDEILEACERLIRGNDAKRTALNVRHWCLYNCPQIVKPPPESHYLDQ
ncbi:hypothetical protein TNCV_1171411 [Trichonephila clavipes]|nr:hypothetical protein TNCV_1171411 [Trichonephila clavipes]